MRRRFLAVSFFVGCLCIFSQPYISLGANKSNLPDFMNQLVFQRKEFSQPIQFCFPNQDSRDVLREIRTTRFGIEKIFYNEGYQRIDKHLLSYLVNHEFCQVESARVQAQYGPGNTYYFLFYTDKFNRLPNLSSGRNQICLDVANRVVKSIDYQNRYKGSPMGIEMQFYAITFSYTLDGSLPELPKLGKTYGGKAKAYQDPDDGKWKLADFKLEDRGKEEFMSQIKGKYAPYDPKNVFIAAREKEQVDGSLIKIGGIFDLSGPTSGVGKDYGQACKDAERYINENGGVDGRKIQLIANDYAYKIPAAVMLYKQYKDVDKVFVIQGWGTGDTNALKQQVNQDNIVYFSTNFAPELADPSKTPYNFYVGTSYSDAIRLAMKFIKNTFTEIFPNEGNRTPRVVFIYPDHPFGKGPIPAGKAMAKELGINVGSDEIVSLRATDATEQLLRMKKFDPDWAWVGGTTPSTSVIAKDAAKLGLRTKFISNMWAFDENLLKLVGTAGNERVYGVAPFAFWGEDVPAMKNVMETANPAGVHTVRYIQGWSAMMVMWEGLKRAASANELNGPGLKNALESLRNFDTGGLTPPITFTPSDHRPNMSLRIFKMSNGKLIWVKNVDIPREDRFLGW